AETVRDICQAANRDGGWPGLVAAGVIECADVTRSAIEARMGSRRLALTTAETPSAPSSSGPHRGRIMLDDIRQALRRLRARPATSLGAMAMLALAVGVTAAMFTIMDAFILRPAPFRDADRLVHIETTLDRGFKYSATPAQIRAWRAS